MRRGSVASATWQKRNQNHYNINDAFRPELTGLWGVPVLQPCSYVPDELYPYDKRKHFQSGLNQAIHFFLDDSSFEAVWLRPEATLPPLLKAEAVITPDFSLYSDWPLSVQLWQIYRTRWLGAFWTSLGIEVIPSVSWSTPESYQFCFDGLPIGGTFAIATMEISEPEAKPLFKAGLLEFFNRCSPDTLLVYGKGLSDFIEPECKRRGIDLHRYLSRLDRVKIDVAKANMINQSRSMQKTATSIKQGVSS